MGLMFKTRSYALVDATINHPDVRPTIEKGKHWLFSADVVSNLNNVVFYGEHGVILCIQEKPGVYKIHMGVKKAGRGKWALQAAKECLKIIFEKYDASCLRIAIPLQLRAARMFCRMAGFRHTGADDVQEFFVY